MHHVRYAGLMLGLGIGLLAGPAAWAGATLDRVTKSGTLVEVVSQSYPPFSQLSPEGDEQGYDIDVAQAVADKLHATLRVETPDWSVIESGNWHGRFDICVCAISRTKDRERVLAFVHPYYYSNMSIVVNAGDQSINGPADLSGKIVGVGVGSTSERYINKTLQLGDPGARPLTYPFENVTPVIYETEDVEYKDLALGAGRRVHALISGELVALGQIAHGGKFRVVQPPVFSSAGWIAADHGDPEWEAKVSGIVDGLQADGTLSKISRKWFGGTDISKP